MKFQCAFIYVAPNCDPEKQRGIIEGDDIDMNVIGCSTYEQAEAAAKEMVAKGCSAIELCAGFGNEGVARIQRQRPTSPSAPSASIFILHSTSKRGMNSSDKIR